ncbi:MAG: Fic family protein [Patescibacteria group bacterium]|nr:Fic family protein [Patescibacteria group bacterium]
MNKSERLGIIMQRAKENQYIQTQEFLSIFQCDRVTVFRDIQQLIKDKKLTQISKGKYSLHQALNQEAYFQTPFYQRPTKKYNFDFLRNYIPNQTSFLNEAQLAVLNQGLAKIEIPTLFYSNNRRLLENILIDVSYSSSSLEGNTYSYLDTEVLIKYNEIAKNKTSEETAMILNHKNALEFLINNHKDLKYSKQTFFNIHSLLSKDLINKEFQGAIRSKLVDIGGSAYTPLDNKSQLTDEFDIFLKKLSAIKNPFEQSLFIAVFIPYLQPFFDLNKRTSRLMLNLPLFKNKLPPVSLLKTEKRKYIDAILAIYELNDTRSLAELYIDNYLENLHRYVN